MNLSKALSRITALALSVMMLLTQTGITAYAEEGAEPPETPQQTEDVAGNADGTVPSDGEGEPLTIITFDEPGDADGGPVSGPASAPPALGYSAIVAFAPLDEEVAEQAAVAGTAPEDLELPDILSATVENGDGQQAQADIPVEGWSAEPEYDPLELGTYLFTPELPEDYTLEDGVELPEITVQVFMGFAPMAIQHTVDSYTDLATRLGEYANANDDMEIVLGTAFPTDTMPGVFTIPGNTNGSYTLTIRSFDSSSPATITRESGITGTLFEVSSGAHLILEDVELDGDNVTASGALVSVRNGGAFTMQDGAVLRDNNNVSGVGGGVNVSGGTFIMEGGEISGNSTNYGGGVYFGGGGSIFTMEGGKISDNTANRSGGGVNVAGGTFTMVGGEISDNTANGSGSTYGGGGVFVGGGTFTMEGGEISGNDAAFGGGVYVTGSGHTFTMKGGVISDNTANGSGSNGGGGVYVTGSGTFTMWDGEISDNTATFNGSGVFVTGSGTFTMWDGEISGNDATSNGGGVFVTGNGTTFTMEGGELSDNTATNGGGVFVTGSTFTMKGGEISDNTATYDGGGVYVTGSGGTFEMEDGEISDNTATNDGGGVYVTGGSSATFTMEGGEISENTATNGSGVYVNSGTFTMEDGLIFGRGSDLTSVIHANMWEPDASGDGVVIAWNEAANNTEYTYETTTDIDWKPSNAAVEWAVSGGDYGISYDKGANNGFVSLPVLVKTPPTAPQKLQAATGNTQVILSWDAPADNGGSAVTRYEVSSDNGANWISAGTNTSHTVTGLTNGTSYTFEVRAVNAVGAGTAASVTATPATVPGAPQSLAATPGDAQVALRWAAPADNGGSAVIRYEVSSDNGSNWISAGVNTGHTVTGLTNGTSYTFQVRAVNAAGAGTAASVTATPVAGGNGGGAAETLTLSPLSNDTVTIGYNYQKRISYSYSGSSAVSLQVTGLPAGLAFDSATSIISGVPTDAAGQYPVQVTVRAGSLSDSGGYTLTLTTTATAASLVMEPLADETVAAGTAYARVPAVTYIGPDTLAYSATGLPAGIAIDSATGRISGTPTVAGAYDITVTVREETGSLSDSQGYRLTVTSSGGNGGGSTGSSSGSSSSGSSSGGSSTPDSRVAKTQLPASAFSWDGGRTLTIDHSGITPLGLLSVRWDGETLVRGTDYTVHSGSVILRFDEDFIAGQKDGNHTVRVEFMNHTGETTVKVGGTGAAGSSDDLLQNPTTGGDTHNPQTGDFDASPWWWMMALLPAAALTFGSAGLIWRRLRGGQ